MFLFLFFFQFLIFLFYFFNVKDGITPLYIAAQNGHVQIIQLLLDQGRANVALTTQVILLIVSFSFFFRFLIFLFYFFNVKDGTTPLYIAAQNGHEQIVQILLERGANVDLADEVILLIVSFSFSFLLFFSFSLSHFSIFLLLKEWSNSSLYCCSKRT